MIAQWAAVLTRWSQRYLPDPFIFVILLSLVVFVMGLLIAGQTPFQMILHWQNGFWNLLTFSMQM
nr:short-chain fatty acid transporter [Bacillota bacterium]